MIWMLAAVVLMAIIFFFVRNRPAAATLTNVAQKKEQAQRLPEGEKVKLASDVRKLALSGYDRGNAKAREAGRNEAFAHEVGVLDAVYCVLANEDSARRNETLRPLLQMETVPFNRLPRDLGRAAVAEYLVWKSFPNQADLPILDEAMAQFTRIVLDHAKHDPDPDKVIYQMIYSQKSDWQALTIPHARAAGE